MKALKSASASASSAKAVLEIGETQFSLYLGKMYLIGRKNTETNFNFDVALEDETVDSKHAIIDVCKNIVQIFDLNSSSGTFLNGRRLDAMHRVNLQGVGILRFGNVEGNLVVFESIESHNSSGFHEEPTASSSEITGLLNKSDHSFIMPAAVSRENISCNILDSSLYDSYDSNRRTDRLSIPETQPFKARNSLNEESSSVDESHCSNDNDSFIPETQVIVVPNMKSKCYETDNAAVKANLPSDIFTDDGETKDSADSQFRICTQMFNDDCFGEEINGNDDGFFESSAVIPLIQHDRVTLSESGKVQNEPRDDRKEYSLISLNNSDEAELDTLNWTANTSSKYTTLDDERNDACTPDLFDLPVFAQDIAKQTKNAPTANKTSTSNDKTETDAASDLQETDTCTTKSADENVFTTKTKATSGGETLDKNDDETALSSKKSYALNDKPGSSAASTSNNDRECVTSLPKPSKTLLYEPSILDGDDYDLMPTQILPHAVAAAAQDGDQYNVSVYLTLSDKENMQPTVVMLTESEKLEKTQLFDCPPKSIDSNPSKSTTSRKSKVEDENSDDNSLASNKSVTDTANTSKKKKSHIEATHTAEVPLLCSDDDLMVTQIFPHAVACSSKTVKTTTSSSSATSKNDTHTAKTPLPCNDFDLMPTQIFPHSAVWVSETSCKSQSKSVSTTTTKSSSSSATSSKNCCNSTLLSVDGYNKIESAESFFDGIEKTPEKSSMQDTGSGEFKKPMLQQKSSLLSVALSQPDEEIDLQMCTPQLIEDKFKQLGNQTKQSIFAAKQRSLFGENSDEEEQDVLELINAPQKQSNDFDKLIPHLKVETATPKKEEKTENKSRSNFNTFKLDLKVDNKTTRSRAERRVARDKKRVDNEAPEEKISKISKSISKNVETKNKGKAKIKSEKDNGKRASTPSSPAKRKTRARSVVGEAALEILETNDLIEKKNTTATIDTDKTSSLLHKSSKRLQMGPTSSKGIESDEAPAGKRLTRLRSYTELKKAAATAVESVEKKDKEKSSKRPSSKEIGTEKDAEISTRNKKSSKISESDHSLSSFKEKEAGASSVKRTRLRSVVSDLTEEKDIDKVKAAVKAKDEKQEKKTTEIEKKRVTRSRSNTESQESISSSSASVRALSSHERKRKMEMEHDTEVKHLRSQTSADESGTTSTNKSTKTIQVSMTMVDPELFQKFLENAGDIWSIAKDPVDSDVLIMDKGNRTFKFLIAMAKGIPIVTSKWLESLNRNKTIPTNNAELFFTDAVFEKRHKFILLKSLEMARKHKLFAGYDFLMTPNILPQPHELKAIIDCAGGTVHAEKPPPLKDNQKIYLISHHQDKQHWYKYRRFNSNIRIISSEGVMASVMRQRVKPLDSYLLG